MDIGDKGCTKSNCLITWQKFFRLLLGKSCKRSCKEKIQSGDTGSNWFWEILKARFIPI